MLLKQKYFLDNFQINDMLNSELGCVQELASGFVGIFLPND